MNREQIRALNPDNLRELSQTMTYQEISEYLKLPKSLISRRCAEYKVKKKRKKKKSSIVSQAFSLIKKI